MIDVSILSTREKRERERDRAIREKGGKWLGSGPKCLKSAPSRPGWCVTTCLDVGGGGPLGATTSAYIL